MEAVRNRLYEITRGVQGDLLGNALMDEVLSACFEYALGQGGALEHLVLALGRFNKHLSDYDEPIAAGLFTGTPQEVSAWAHQLTSEILSHRDHLQ